ncbi:hypothetical protein SAMN05443428_10223 [Caloramator quimbayensis]|uniref:2-amino-4-ketopentanoate thiolase alpha subunit n=1 Tax=Caloramator quimbayensis TaxID=1147123 RepID=A0A1T4WJD7_9CLOT|nr:2-amino-4-oxopentanoate thiolase subunit OrtA [Caloramator quimbayensis]SKA77443.1 hypothetical protein SAMN05443428_10223 [Caloramator quimbayensis]
MNTARKGQWVEIENLVLKPEERAPQVPEDTKAVPLMMWTKGFLEDEAAEIGDVVTIKTLSGRITSGKLVVVNPRHEHNFGHPVEELLDVGVEVRKEIENL